MPEALAQVKRELGPDAIILGTRKAAAPGLPGVVGREQVEITATAQQAADAPASPRPAPAKRTDTSPRSDPRGARRAAPAALPRELLPYYQRLVENEVAEELAARIVQNASGAAEPGPAGAKALRDAIRAALAELMPATGEIRVAPGAARRVALVGPPGAGKTTTIAKLAARYKLREKRRVAILSLDTHRFAAHEQMRRYGELIGVPVRAAQTCATVREALEELKGAELLLIDTPGLGLRDTGRFARTTALLRGTRPDETHLALPASFDAAVQQRILRAFEPLGAEHVLLTRLDEAIGMGVVLNAAARLKRKLSYLSTGQTVPNDIEAACGGRMADALLSAPSAASASDSGSQMSIAPAARLSHA
jgi:flagellar biosynthesis protein FlhF